MFFLYAIFFRQERLIPQSPPEPEINKQGLHFQARAKGGSMRRLVCLALGLVSVSQLFADPMQKAADFACATEKKHNLSRLAVFTFTDADGEETDESSAQGTQFLSLIAGCDGLTVIDKSAEEDVLDEQAFGQTGIVDEKTMVPVGQLTGSDSLLFGISGPQGLELRLIDAKTGALLAAQIFSGEENPQPAPANPDYFTKRWLVDSVRTQPPVYLYVTTTPAQWNILCARHPNLERYYKGLSENEQRQLTLWRERIEKMRGENRLPQSHDRQFRRDAVRISHEQTRGFSNGRWRQNRFHTRMIGRQPRRQGIGERAHIHNGQAGHGDTGRHGAGQHPGHNGGHHSGHGGRR